MTTSRISKNFLKVLVDPEDPDVDIVAVHGLNPTNTSFHAEATWTAEAKLWFRDFLPEKLPNARVLLFGYNANIAFETSTAGVREQAMNLLNRIASKREDAEDRPIVFVAHSLGGIVVKRALVEAKLDESYKSIREATYGIAFFGTPHQGGNHAKLGNIASSILQSVLRNPANTFMEALKKDSLFSDNLAGDFRHQLEDYYVLSFFETLPTGKLGIIVDQKSATLGLAGLRERQIPMDANHTDVCKFSSADGDDYDQVSYNLVRLTKRAVEAVAERKSMASLSVPSTNPLSAAASPQAQLQSGTGNQHWTIRRTVNSLFTGREKILHDIIHALQPCNDHAAVKMQKRFVITGLGGQGKSEICLRVADLMRQDFWGVFWVDVSSTSTVQTDFIAVAKAIGSSAESIDEARQILANRSETWLLILDNADDAGVDYQIYFPSGTRGSIILTSRIPECSQYNTVGSKALTGLSDQDSIELLLKATQIHPPSWPTHEPAAKQVIEILGSHTLALIQAGAYVAMGYCQLEQYPGEYDRRRARLLKFAPKQAQSRYGDVYATFEVSAHILESSKGTVASDALDLLGILSMLHHRDVPVQLFEDAWERSQHISDYENEGLNHLEILTKHHVSTLPDFVNEQGARWDGFRLKDAIRLLASLALISVDCGFLSMHLLTHAWSADRQSLDQQVKTWNSTGSVLAFPGSWYDTWRAYEKQFRLHIRHHLDRGMEGLYNSKQNDATAMIPVLFHCIWNLSAMGDDSKVGEVLDWFFEESNLDSDVPFIPWLPLYNLRGKSLIHLGKSVQTIKLLERVMEVITATLAETDRDRLTSQHVLSMAYIAKGQTQQGIKLLEQIVDIDALTLADNSPERLASQRELAIGYRKNGQIEKAIELLKTNIEASTLAESHSNRLASQHELGIAYRENGQNKQAIELLEQVVRLQDNPSRLLGSQYELALAYRENGQTKEAVELLEQVVRLQDNPSRLLVLQRELARAYQANGQIEKAKDLLQALSRT